MPKLIKKASNKIGLPPGTLVHVGEKKLEKTRISIFAYDQHQIIEQAAQTIEECFPYKDKPAVTWINIDGLHETEIIEKLGAHFEIHPLVLEDILHTEQRPKFEDFGNYIYIVLKMLSYDDKNDQILEEQVSIILGANFVITFQENVGDVFDPVRERIRNGRFQLKRRKADYLAYALMDAIVDNYFLILEKIEAQIESLEEDLLDNPSLESLKNIHLLKRKMIVIRKTIWPLREVIGELEDSESSLFDETTSIYLKDIHDHTIRVIDSIDTYRDMVAIMVDTYLSNISNRMNEVMKVLTIIATIFIPLTFIAGIYGMNFEFMPELQWRWGYPLIWGIMIIIGVGMLLYFRKKKWF